MKLNWLKVCQGYGMGVFRCATNEEQIWKVLKQFSVRFLIWTQELKNKEALICSIRNYSENIKWIVVCKQKSISLIYQWQRWLNPTAIWWIGDVLHIDFSYFFTTHPLGYCHISPSLQNLFYKPLIQLSQYEVELLKGLQQGKSHQQLCRELPWSSSSIYKRKSRLKELFGIPMTNDCKLVYTATSLGYIDSV